MACRSWLSFIWHEAWANIFPKLFSWETTGPKKFPLFSCIANTGWMRGAEPYSGHRVGLGWDSRLRKKLQFHTPIQEDPNLSLGPASSHPATPFITEQGEAREGKFQKKGDTWNTGSYYSPEEATCVDVSRALSLPCHVALDVVLPLRASVPSSTKWGNTHPADLSGGSHVTVLCKEHKGPLWGDGLWRRWNSCVRFRLPAVLCP